MPKLKTAPEPDIPRTRLDAAIVKLVGEGTDTAEALAHRLPFGYYAIKRALDRLVVMGRLVRTTLCYRVVVPFDDRVAKRHLAWFRCDDRWPDAWVCGWSLDGGADTFDESSTRWGAVVVVPVGGKVHVARALGAGIFDAWDHYGVWVDVAQGSPTLARCVFAGCWLGLDDAIRRHERLLSVSVMPAEAPPPSPSAAAGDPRVMAAVCGPAPDGLGWLVTTGSPLRFVMTIEKPTGGQSASVLAQRVGDAGSPVGEPISVSVASAPGRSSSASSHPHVGVLAYAAHELRGQSAGD